MTDSKDFDQVAAHVHHQVAKNERVRENLPGEGRIRIDRQLPFMCVYRRPSEPDPGTQDLVTSEAAYLYASGEPQYRVGVAKLCGEIASMMQEHFGIFLFIEIWSEAATPSEANPAAHRRPSFTILGSGLASLPTLVEAFQRSLATISIDGHAVEITTREVAEVAAPDLPALTKALDPQRRGGCLSLGLAVRPVYRCQDNNQLYPMILQSLRSQLAKAIRQAVAEFTGSRVRTARKQVHYQSLGPTAYSKAALRVDQQLCDVSQSFDFLLLTTPVNVERAWEEFHRAKLGRQPVFQYPPLPFHISMVKRRLFAIPIEQVEDPTLSSLFYEKQDEIDKELTALRHLESEEFLYCSFQLYGKVDEPLATLAGRILEHFPQPRASEGTSHVEFDRLLSAVKAELDYYQQQYPDFQATVEVCDQLASGLMVSQHRLLLARSLRLAEHRVGPLLHHEVGTHLLTYFNGRSQPLRQLYAGLAGYDELQEGLAVLAEYLTGGLTIDRLRTLAARVVAADSMTRGTSFANTFLCLCDQYRFSPRESFSTTLRAYRGGGSTKDIIYLRGLRDLLEYLSHGHDLEPLYVGKLGLEHVPRIQELRRRSIVKAPALMPRFWTAPGIRERLDRCRTRSVVELIEGPQ